MSWRIFVAAYPPPPVADALLAAAADLELPRHRTTPPDQVHLTLQFVGDVDSRDLDGVLESVERAAAGVGPCEVAPDRWITLPERGPARLIAAAAPEVPALSELSKRLATRLARNVRKGKSRFFLPHLTLLRFRPPVTGLRLDVPIEPRPFTIDHIHVMRSILRPEGAEHREVREIGL